MKLFQHPDFGQAILGATEYFGDRGLRPGVIEKDYYVTEALRILATVAGDKIIFKGGTSLSKGWNLIDRFSEDIDIFLDPLAFEPALNKRASIESSRFFEMQSVPILHLNICQRRAGRSAASAGTTDSAIPRFMVVLGRSQIACSWKQVPQAVANRRRPSSYVPT